MQRFKKYSASSKQQEERTQSRVDVPPNKVKSVLQECYFIISDLKAKNKMLEDEVNQKKSIINKLIQEKQEHLLHLSVCQSDHFKKQLEATNKRSEQMKQSFENVLQNYERIIRKYQSDLEKLKGFNKVLRTENTHLRNEVSHAKTNWRQREKKIGKITIIKNHEQIEEPNKFQFTMNRSESLHPIETFANAKLQSITPQKIMVSKSTNLSTAAKSSSKQSSKHAPERRQSIPRNLFHNTRLNDQLISSGEFQRRSSDEQGVNSSQSQTIGIWFNRLKKLLAESDEEI